MLGQGRAFGQFKKLVVVFSPDGYTNKHFCRLATGVTVHRPKGFHLVWQSILK
jgi:hypothetical protein